MFKIGSSERFFGTPIRGNIQPARLNPSWTDSTRFSGASLTAEEKKLLRQLPKTAEPARLVIFTDPGFDVDDETALVVAAALQKRGLVDIKAVVGTTLPSQGRALLAKGVLKELGLGHVPVAVGSDHAPDNFSPEAHRLQAKFLPNANELAQNSQVLLQQTLQAAADKSLTLLVIANMVDAAEVLKANETLFQQKVKQVVVMGGVRQNSEDTDESATDVQLTQQGLMAANDVAFNNCHPQASANYFHQKVQEFGIPIKVITRKAATSTPIRPDFFTNLAKTKNPVALHIREIEGDFLNKFWRAAYREKMGPSRDRNWFKSSFCKPGTPDTLTDNDDILPYLKSRVLYDAIALLACVDVLSAQLFEPVSIKVKNTMHQIIGLSGKATGLLNPGKLATLLSALAKDGLMERTF